MLVSDYDQTFYVNDQDIEQNKKQVEKFRKAGNLFVIATGRSYLDFKKVKDKYHLSYDYCFINHGATILDAKDNILRNIPINNTIISKLNQDLELEYSKSHFYCTTFQNMDKYNKSDLTKINVYYQDKEFAIQKAYSLNQKYNTNIKAYYIGNTGVEIISNQTNKAKAIAFLIKQHEIPERNVYTIGDSYNDIEMIQTFNGYCMKQSVPELKKVSKAEYTSVSNLIKDLLK